MGTILIGNIKGPQGSQGIQGPQGPVGPVGPTGPGADIYNGLDQTEAGVAGLDAYQGKILDQKKLDANNVVNNLTTTESGYALDARQGKTLDDKITAITTTTDVTGVANENNVTGTCSGKKRGYMVTLNVDCVAAKDLTSSGWTLFTGLPASINQARTTMYNVTKNQPISIGVNTAGNLVMMYAGSLSTGDAVKGGITYITSE